MERQRRLSSTATSKLKNFKDFLTSAKSLHHQKHNSSNKSLTNYDVDGNVVEECSKRHSNHRNSSKKNSVSLFDLVDPPVSSSRPTSVALSSHINIHSINNDSTISNGKNGKSVSCYGLSDCRTSINKTVATTKKPPSSKNPAIRLFNTIKEKFGIRRKRDRIVDNSQTRDAGSFFSNSPNNGMGDLRGLQNNSMILSSSRSQEILSSSQDEQLNFDDTFAAPFGCRNIDNVSSTAISMPYLHRIELTNSEPKPNSIEIDDEPKPAIPLKQRAISNATNTLQNSKNNNTDASNKNDTKLKSSLTKELCDLLHYGWYWGGMSKEEAEEKLKGEPEGAFVVRDSSSDHYLLSLSFNSNEKTLHTRIEYRNGKFCFYASETESFDSVAELINYWITNSDHGIFCYSRSRRRNPNLPSHPVRLVQPISRFTEVKSLAHQSRFVIRQYTRFDLIPQLPLPPSLIEYVGQQRYI